MPRRSVLGLAMEIKYNEGKTTQVPTGRVIGVRSSKAVDPFGCCRPFVAGVYLASLLVQLPTG